MIQSGNVPKPHQKGRNVEDRQRESPIFTPILPCGLILMSTLALRCRGTQYHRHRDFDRRRMDDAVAPLSTWTGFLAYRNPSQRTLLFGIEVISRMLQDAIVPNHEVTDAPAVAVVAASGIEM
jgi:hypothetical protein